MEGRQGEAAPLDAPFRHSLVPHVTERMDARGGGGLLSQPSVAFGRPFMGNAQTREGVVAHAKHLFDRPARVPARVPHPCRLLRWGVQREGGGGPHLSQA